MSPRAFVPDDVLQFTCSDRAAFSPRREREPRVLRPVGAKSQEARWAGIVVERRAKPTKLRQEHHGRGKRCVMPLLRSLKQRRRRGLRRCRAAPALRWPGEPQASGGMGLPSPVPKSSPTTWLRANRSRTWRRISSRHTEIKERLSPETSPAPYFAAGLVFLAGAESFTTNPKSPSLWGLSR